MSTDQCDGGNTNGSKDMSSGGWFSRMFSRSNTNVFDTSDPDAFDGNEGNAESAEQKQGMNDRVGMVLGMFPQEITRTTSAL